MTTPQEAVEHAALALVGALAGDRVANHGTRELLRQLRERIERWVAARPPAGEPWRAILAAPQRRYSDLVDLLARLVQEDVVARHLVERFSAAEPPRTKIHYCDFVITIEESPSGVAARLLDIPCGERCSEPIDLSAFQNQTVSIVRSLESKIHTHRDTRRQSPSTGPSISIEQLGQALFQALFVGCIRDAWQAGKGLLAGRPDLGLRLRLLFDLRSSALRPLAALPWELLRDPASDQVLCKDVRTPVVRSLEVPTGALELSPRARKILMVCSQPTDQASLNVKSEIRAIEEAWRLIPGLHSRDIPADLEGLQEALQEQPFDVLHFMGHGDFDPISQEGLVVFEHASGTAREIPARVLVEQLSGVRLALVVLSSCSGGTMPRVAAAGPFSSVAAAFVRAGFPAVVAMQFPISDNAAITFSRKLYRRLAMGDSVEAAVTKGRLAISEGDPESPEWVTPVLYLA